MRHWRLWRKVIVRDGSAIFDADGHVIESTRLWWDYLDPKFRSRVVPDDQRLGAINGALMPLVDGHPTFAGSPVMTEQLRTGDTTDQMVERFGSIAERGFDPAGLLEGMDAEGIDATAVYPSFGLHVPYCQDAAPDLATALARAYNRWIGEYCAAGAGRIVGVGLAPLHDPELAEVEIRRTVEHDGTRAIMVRPNPIHGRTIHAKEHDRIFGALVDLDVPLILHEGRGANVKFAGDDRFDTWYASHAACHPMEAMLAFAGLVVDGVFDRHPRLRVAFLESGTGWLPYWLDRMDEHHEMWAPGERPYLKQLPSEYFAQHCTISGEGEDRFFGSVVATVGSERVMWSSDFPHMECKWPHSVDLFYENVSLSPADTHRVLWETPCRLYAFDGDALLRSQSQRS